MKTYAEYLLGTSFEEWEIPTRERPLRKIVLASPVDSSDSDNESGAEQADLPVCKCQPQHENSDSKSDVLLMECWIMTQSKMANKILIQRQE